MTKTSAWRRWTFRILVGVFALSFVLSTIAIWANYRIQDSDTWAETVAPLASDPAIQERIVDQTAMLIENQMRADEEAGQLRTITINQTMPLVRMLLNDFVTSNAFAEFWGTANYYAHQSLIAAVNGGDDILLRTDGENLMLGIQPVVDWLNPQLAEALPDSNYTINLSPDSTTIELYSAEGIKQLVQAFELVDTLAFVLPIVMVASLLGAILVASTKKAAIGQLALTLTITAAVVLTVITIAKVLIINILPAADRDVLSAILRIVLIDLVRAFRAAAAIGLVAFGVITLARSQYKQVDSLRGWLRRNRGAIAGAGIGLATLYLILSNSPMLWLTGLCLVAIIVCTVALIAWRRGDGESVQHVEQGIAD